MKYIVKRLGRSIEISEANSSLLVYRIPYQNLVSGEKEPFEIKNKFIVYILFGENGKGKNMIYVGKSKNGMKNRPTAHDNKYGNWSFCYVLTQFEERTFFNDGTIQYIEDKINKKVNDLGRFENTTLQTTSGTANQRDIEDCDEYLDKAFQMLDVLGLDLITYVSEDDETITENEMDKENCVPNGIYTFSQKIKRWKGRRAEATMQVVDGKFILLAGSNVCPFEGDIYDAVRIKRANANIVDDRLQEDIVFSSPSGPAIFVTGGSRNGWLCWKDKNGKAINQYRKNQ